MSTDTANQRFPLVDRLRAFAGNRLIAHSRSYREALAELVELRRRVAAMATDLRQAEATRRQTDAALAESRATVASTMANFQRSEATIVELGARVAATREALRVNEEAYGRAEAALAEFRAKTASMTVALQQAEEARGQAQRQADASLAELHRATTAMTSELQATREALRHTQDVLFQQQIDFGLIDHRTGEQVRHPANLPSILLLAPPKTGGAHIMTVLQRGLRLQRRWMATGHFYPCLIDSGKLDAFWRAGNCVAFHHCEASGVNLGMLAQTDLKLLLNLRDFRQCMVSLVHYTMRHLPRPYSVLHPAEPPDAYALWPHDSPQIR